MLCTQGTFDYVFNMFKVRLKSFSAVPICDRITQSPHLHKCIYLAGSYFAVRHTCNSEFIDEFPSQTKRPSRVSIPPGRLFEK